MKKPRYNRIKAVLAEKGISNRELAKAIDVSDGAVSTWCRNFKQPNLEMLFVIAKHLQLEPADLINTRKVVGG